LARQDWAKAAYGFFSNGRVNVADILPGRIRSTSVRFAGTGGTALVLHDTAEFTDMAIGCSISDPKTAAGGDRLAILRKFGVMWQSGALFGSMSSLENMRLPLDEFTDLPEPIRELAARRDSEQISNGLSKFAREDSPKWVTAHHPGAIMKIGSA
jgi:hypothetical protein